MFLMCLIDFLIFGDISGYFWTIAEYFPSICGIFRNMFGMFRDIFGMFRDLFGMFSGCFRGGLGEYLKVSFGDFDGFWGRIFAIAANGQGAEDGGGQAANKIKHVVLVLLGRRITAIQHTYYKLSNVHPKLKRLF